MKIRTDFVTNSSSSSFVVEITFKTVGGKNFSTSMGGEEFSNTDLACTAQDILDAPDLQALLDTIKGGPGADRRDKSTLTRFKNSLKTSVEKLEDIASISFERRWFAWGEYASCFGSNIKSYVPEVYEIATQICEAQKNKNPDEEKRLKNRMIFELLHNKNIIFSSSAHFPTGFMGGPKSGFVLNVCKFDQKSLGAFARKVAKGSIPELNTDRATECTIIDMQNKTYRQEAIYGNCNTKLTLAKKKAEIADSAKENG